MGCSTKAFVCTDNKDFWAVTDLIVATLQPMINEVIKRNPQKFGGMGNIRVERRDNHSRTAMLTFCIGDVNLRNMYVFFDFDSDHSDTYKGSKITFDLSAWGSSELIIKSVAEAFKDWGDVYYCANDCSDEFVKL